MNDDLFFHYKKYSSLRGNDRGSLKEVFSARSATKKRFVLSRWDNLQTEFGRLPFEMFDRPLFLFGVIDGSVR